MRNISVFKFNATHLILGDFLTKKRYEISALPILQNISGLRYAQLDGGVRHLNLNSKIFQPYD